MKSSNIIYGSIGFVGLSVASFFLYKKYGGDQDDREFKRNIKDIQKIYGYTPKSIPNGGGKSRKRKNNSNNKTKYKK